MSLRVRVVDMSWSCPGQVHSQAVAPCGCGVQLAFCSGALTEDVLLCQSEVCSWVLEPRDTVWGEALPEPQPPRWLALEPFPDGSSAERQHCAWKCSVLHCFRGARRSFSLQAFSEPLLSYVAF